LTFNVVVVATRELLVVLYSWLVVVTVPRPTGCSANVVVLSEVRCNAAFGLEPPPPELAKVTTRATTTMTMTTPLPMIAFRRDRRLIIRRRPIPLSWRVYTRLLRG
jgi:hypothetical protein